MFSASSTIGPCDQGRSHRHRSRRSGCGTAVRSGLWNSGEIILGQPAAILLLMAQDRARDVAAIERIARRLQAGEAIAVRVRPLLIRHVLQRAREIALHEDLAHLRRTSVRAERSRPCSATAKNRSAGRRAARRGTDRSGTHRVRSGSPPRPPRRTTSCRSAPVRRSRCSGAAGTTVCSSPSGMRPPKCRWKCSTSAAFGQTPTPLITWVSARSPRWIITGATPPKPTNSLSSTSIARPVATPASIALPPASRTCRPASEA